MDMTSNFLLQASVRMNKYPPICTQLRNKCINECMGGVGIDTQVVCKWCYSAWNDGKFLLMVGPQKKKKMLKKGSSPAKHFNILVLTCLVCQRKTKIPLAKDCRPKDTSKSRQSQEETEGPLVHVQGTKKVKKKDKFYGLNPDLFANIPTVQHNSKTKHNQTSIVKDGKCLTVHQEINNLFSPNKKKLKKQKKSKKKKKQPSSIHSFINDC